MTEIFVNSDSVRLWTIAQGSGVPIVLCNGGPGCCDYLAPVAAMLDDLAQVIRFEARGCGRSDQVPPYTLATCLADLEAIRQHYRVERWIVGGHSWGADLALAYALGYPERVHGLVCISGGRVHNDREWHRIYSERRDQGLETLPAFDYPPNLEVNAEVGRSWKQYIQRPSLLKEIARLDRPALFLYGDQDIRPSWPIEQVAQLLPNAALTMIAGADHHIWVTHADAMRAPLRVRPAHHGAGGMKTTYQQAIALQQEWVRAGHDADICRCCGAHVLGGVQGCFELYSELAVRPTAQAAPLAASTYRVNAHALQHPEIHGKTNNAAHLLWLCWLFEFGGDASLPGGPPWWRRGARGEVPVLSAPEVRGAITVVDVAQATSPDEHLRLSEQWARSVYNAWRMHHDWARREVQRRWAP